MDELLSSLNNLSDDRRRALAALLKRKGINLFERLPILHVDRAGRLPLSYAQQRLWFLAELDPDSGAYNIAEAVRLQGSLDLPAFQRSLDALVERHEILRTTFPSVDGQPFQHVHEQGAAVVAVIDLRLEIAALAEREWRAQQIAEAEADTPFDLARGPLLRVKLICLGDADQVLLVTMHHIVSDGWSMGIVIDELARRYAAELSGQPSDLAPLPIQYVDYGVWQRGWLDAGEGERQLAYWKEQLGNEHPVLELPLDHARPAVQTDHGATVRFTLPAAVTAGIEILARKHGATPFMVLLAAWNALLYRHTGQLDLRVGVPIANRGRAETEGLVGFFVNTQVLRVEVDARQGLAELLGRVREAALGGQAHQDLPFEQLVEALRPERSLGHNPLFQVMYNHQRPSYGALGKLPGLVVQPLPRDSHTTQFDLSLDTEEDAAGAIHGVITYATDLFDAATIDRLSAHLQRLLAEVVAAPERPIAQLQLLDADERARIDSWNPRARAPGTTLLAHESVQRHAVLFPGDIAVIGEGYHLAYGDLAARARQLAAHLQQLGVGPETVVGVALPRSPHLIVGLLGVMESGGAFLPLDPQYPADRLAYMMADAGMRVLVTDRDLLARLSPAVDQICVCLDDLVPGPVADAFVPPALAPDHLAYLIYTSGSTGKPKGVAVSHGGLAMHAKAIGAVYGLGRGEVMLQFASVSFDGAIDQWLAPLMAGATVVLRGADLWSVERTLEEIAAHRITVVDLLPSYLLPLAEAAIAGGQTLPVRICGVGGEGLPRESLAPIQRALGTGRLINGYGPTETVVTPLVWEAPLGARFETPHAPIGRPVGDRTAYVLDADLNCVPVGVPGELYLGGSGIARGYHGRPGLTAERFVPDLHDSQPGGRLYRTGDRARWRADGTVEYLGRVDHQVKIRGFRIELGEIEAQLLAHPSVDEAVVVVREERGARRLVGYVVAGDAADDAADLPVALTAALAGALPDYMVPGQILVLAALPRTPAGKVDRAALPVPERPAPQATVAPRTPVEQSLAEIWQAVLGIERVGVTDNFFELGGDSIVSIQVVSRARQAGIGISPKDLFLHQTVEALARVVSHEPAAAALTVSVRPSGEVALTPIQAEFFARAVPDRHHHNQAILLEARRPLDVALLTRALHVVVDHHDALRLRFSQTPDGRWQQRHVDDPPADLLWQRVQPDLTGLGDLCDEAQRSLDLGRGPLLRALHVTPAVGAAQLLLVVHHLVVDGVSWRILLSDLQTAYGQLARGQTINLPPATSSFQSWAARLVDHAASPALLAELPYWEARIGGVTTVIPCDDPGGSALVRDLRSVTCQLDRADTQRLLRDAPSAYRTQIVDLLLTALARALRHWTGQPSTLITLEGHGREDLFADVDLARTVGWFTSTFPVRLDTSDDLATSIKTIKEDLRQIPGHGIGHGLLEWLGPADAQARLRALPRAQISFNYLGQFDQTFDDPDAPLVPSTHGAGADQGGDEPLENWLEINGQIYDGVLALTFSHSRAVLRPETVDALKDAFRDELLAVIDHCTAAGAAGVTPSDFPLARLDQAALDRLPVPAAEIEDVYPLAPMQQGMLFHSLYAPEQAGTYVNQIRVSMDGLDLPKFSQAWQDVVDRHEILRTGFVWGAGLREPLQIVHRTAGPVVEIRREIAGPAAVEALCAAEHVRGFDLGRPPLMRVVLVPDVDPANAARCDVIWTSHHLLLDGWSSARLLGEVVQLYRGLGPLPPLAGRYRDHLAWLAAQDRGVSESFWRADLAPIEEPTLLAAANPVRQPGTGHGLVRLRLDLTRTAQLVRFCQQERITPNTLVQGAWGVLLQRYTGRDAVLFGATVSGRPPGLRGAESLLGLFINTVPVVVQPRPSVAVGDWLRALQARGLERLHHEHVPLHEIQRWSGRPGQALFDSLLVFENYAIDRALRERRAGMRVEEQGGVETTNYPLTLGVNWGETLEIGLDHDRVHLDDATAARLGEHLERLLLALAVDARQPLGALTMIAPRELAAVTELNARPPRRREIPVHHEIACQAALYPETNAVTCAGKHLTFAALERRSNQLAHRLCQRGVGPEVRVGIAIERSVEMVVAMLAVWKAGGAYVPLDPGYPPDRLAFMMADAGLALLLTQSDLRAGLPIPASLACLCIDDADVDADGLPITAPTVPLGPEALAYVIYTSGSTGQPKGVAVAHGPLAMHARSAGELYGMTAADRALHFASISFDGAVEQWVVPLMHGAGLVISGPELWDGQEIARVVEREAVTVIYPPTSHLLELATFVRAAGRGPRLRICTVGGEAVARESLDLIQGALGPDKVINGYGPTETVVTPLLWIADAGTTCATAYAPIGAPVGDRTIYVLGPDLDLLPAGVTGELYIGGSGMARGYHQRPGLTALRFVPDPFGPRPGGRLYRTGDLVRLGDDGTVEYIGRVDHQVKIRGFRIELGEIEAHLLAHAAIAEAVVVARDDGVGRRLVAYVAAAAVPGPDVIDELRAQLGRALPAHMVPAQIVALSALPRTPVGKIDRAALPAPDRPARAAQVAPRNAKESTLAAIWQDVLGLAEVGVTDNFFELGGDSIMSIQVVSRARQAGLALTPKDLFGHPTVAALAQIAGVVAAAPAIAQGPATGAVPLTPIQAAFFAAQIPDRHHFNQAVLLEAHRPLNLAALERALAAVGAHHDGFRLRFRQDDTGAWAQAYAAPALLPADPTLTVRTASSVDEIEPLCDEVHRELDLAAGPLWRAVVITLPDATMRLLLVVHHLVVDGVSWRVLLEDLETAYRQLASGGAVALPAKTSSYQVWAQRLQQHAAGATITQEAAHWERTLGQAGDIADLPRDFPAGSILDRDSVAVSRQLNRAQTARLLRQAPQAYRSQIADLLLAALGQTLRRWTGQDRTLVELEGHGREDLFDDVDVSRTVGWFTTVFPVVLAASDDPGATIKAVKEHLRQVPARGLGHGVLSHLAPPDLQARLRALPRPGVSFNYLGQFDGSFDRAAGPGAAPDDSDASLLRPARESSGQERSPLAPLAHPLEVGGQIYHGQLTLTLTYSRAVYQASTVDRLADGYQADLLALIDHCAGASGVTPSDFPLARLDQAALDRLPVPPAAIEDIYPLSPMQAGMLFHSLQAPDAGIYVSQVSLSVDDLDAGRFRDAWQAVVARHDILRTGFVWSGGLAEPVQIVHRTVGPVVEELDWRDREVTPAQIQALAAAEHTRGFDLARPPLLRAVLVRLGDRRHQLIWTSHHLLLDGWSSARLMTEVVEHYQAPALASPPSSSAPVARYRDYVAWLARQDRAVGERFWRDQLLALEEPTLLAAAVPPAGKDAGHAVHTVGFDAAASGRLQRFAQRERITVNTLVQGAWAVLLQRHTGKRVVSFGATVSGRPAGLAGAEGMLGLFINTLPVVLALDPAQPVGLWLRALQQHNAGLREHEHTPLYEIQRWAGRAGQALFDTLLVFENYPVDAALQAGEGGPRFGRADSVETTNYPLTLSITADGALEVALEYDRACFAEAQIQQLGAQLEDLLVQLADDPDRCLGDLNLRRGATVTTQARPCGTHVDQPLVHTQISAHAALRPQAEALRCAGRAMTFAALESAANQLAHRLQRLGVGPEIRVGVAVERSVEMVVAMLAVLKAGGAYVPLDPQYPEDRLRHMITDADVRVLITQRSLGARLPVPAGVTTVFVDDRIDDLPQTPPRVYLHADNLAYVIYTSGSTGRAKGVAVSHGALGQHCQAIAATYALDPGKTMLQFASVSFDGAIDQWLAPLTRGARVLVRGPVLWGAEEAFVEIAQHGVTAIDLLPSYLIELARWGAAHGRSLPVEVCAVGGEALPRETFDLVQRALRPGRLINGYGPTETVVTPLVWEATAATACATAYAPIGQTIGPRTAHVLDADLNPIPPGVAGELFIGGTCLARGYHQRPGLTAERFVPDPFTASPGARLYRTGDLVRWLPDGNVEFLGRADQQVKIRGFRIELGEVEAQLQSHPAVQEAVVIARADGSGKRLVAYVVAADSAEYDAPDAAGLPETLAAHVRAALPDYMVPAPIIVLPALPRTPAGKIDRLGLPVPERLAAAAVLAPRTPLEQTLVGLWSQVLGVDRIGVTDNFFDLGGHSLLAVALVSAISAQLGTPVSLGLFLARPTVADLAAALDSPRDANAPGELVALNHCPSPTPPLFCLHPAGGTVFAYAPMARALATQRPVYGIQSRSFVDPAWIDGSVTEMADRYAATVTAAQPEGPVHLLGWSLGGTIAMALAGALEQAGREVAFLGLVDSFVPGLPGGTVSAADAAAAAADDERDARLALEAAGLTQSLSPTQIAHGITVMKTLSALADDHHLAPVDVAPTCWWAEASGPVTQQAQSTLEAALGQPSTARIVIAADHTTIIQSPEFLRSLATGLSIAVARRKRP